MLNSLQKLVDDLKSTNSTNHKIGILAKHSDCKKFLFYVYHPLKQYHVTSKNLKKMKNLEGDDYTEFEDIFKMLDSLDATRISGHHAIRSVNNFIEQNKEHEELIYNIIDKNLKCRVNASLINKVFKDLIPEFKPALAYVYEDYEKKVNFENDTWYASKKLNGIRCIIIKEGDSITLFSRTGKEFFTLDELKPYILDIDKESFVLDGELCIIDENGKEDFTAIVSEVRMKNHTIKTPKFMAFDFLEVDNFYKKKSKEKLSERLEKLQKYVIESQYIGILEQIKIENMDGFKKIQGKSAEKNWEGLILRKDVPYEGKRSKNLLKFKLFEQEEFVVKDIENDFIRHIIYEDGVSREIESEMMSKAVIEYNGYNVGVGSGWSINQRLEYYNDLSKIIGKTITVRYFMPSKNKQGGESLQHPTVKKVWDNERDV